MADDPGRVIRTGFPMYCAHFPGGDPRRWEPDLDGCTLEEVERWKAAVLAANERRDLADIDGAAIGISEPGCGAIVHLTMFGCGAYWYEEDWTEEFDPFGGGEE